MSNTNANTQKATSVEAKATSGETANVVEITHNTGNPEQTPQVAPEAQEVETTNANPLFIQLSERLGMDTQDLDSLIEHCLNNLGNFLIIAYKAAISDNPQVFLPQVIELIEESGIELPVGKITELIGQLKAKPEFQQLATGISHPLIGQISLPNIFTTPEVSLPAPRLETIKLESFDLRFDIHSDYVSIHNGSRPAVKISNEKFAEIKRLNELLIKTDMDWRARQYQTGTWVSLFIKSEDIVSAGMAYVYAK